MDLHPAQVFYKQGYYFSDFKPSRVFDALQTTLAQISRGPLKDNFGWLQKEKYIGSKDLRPYCWDYDPVFLDILFDQNVPELLEKLVGYRPMLLTANVRVNLPGQPYSTWHRDTSHYCGRVKGNIPPLINLHYYPCLDQAPESQLQLWPGTHNFMSSYQLLDRAIVKLIKPLSVVSGRSSFVILNTSVLHRITQTDYPHGAMRLMYTFGRDFQAQTHPEQRSLHDLYLNHSRHV